MLDYVRMNHSQSWVVYAEAHPQPAVHTAAGRLLDLRLHEEQSPTYPGGDKIHRAPNLMDAENQLANQLVIYMLCK